jgi:probable DNA repair protein
VNPTSIEAAWASLAAGATLLTAQARLARELRRAYDERQQQAGGRAWEAPVIVPLSAWLEQVWREHGDRVLLNPAQERWLWDEAVRGPAGPAGPGRMDTALLDVEATAAAAAAAWELAHAWALPWNDAAWGQNQETAAFHHWVELVRERCRRGGWITAAELPQAVAGLLRGGEASIAKTVWMAGFDEVAPPRQRELMEAMAAAGMALNRWPQPERRGSLMQACQAPDAAQEMAAAARWAHQLWMADPSQSIAMVAPGLDGIRDLAAHAFAAEFHPERAPWAAAPPAFHLSLGRPLTAWPVAAAALELLEWALTPAGAWLDPARAAAIVSSPFLAGAEQEAGPRARLRPTWARQGRSQIAAEALGGAETARFCPGLARALAAGRDALRGPGTAPLASWTQRFAASLAAMGWPGERGLSSAEHQACEVWQQALTGCASLDAVNARGPVTADAALRNLRAVAAGRLFQPEQAGGGVQIMGWLEAAGLEFDHLWITGLDDTAVPAPAAPHPFLPRRWQAELGLPHATPAQTSDFAQRQLDRLRRSADAIAISYAANDGERPLQPSPLLPWEPIAWTPVEHPMENRDARRQAADIAALDDTHAPPATGADAEGGTGIFKEQAACPFRAFVHRRLHAEAADAPPAGLTHTTRGTLLHAVLQRVFEQLGSQARLLAMSADERRGLAAQAAAAVTGAEPLLHARPGLADAEMHRLTDLVTAWLEVELTRPAFHVEALEHERQLDWGGLKLKLRLDRIDQLDGGGRVLLDYKSGKVSPGLWDMPRPEEPQLPVYAVTDAARDSIGGIAFVQLRFGDVALKKADCTPGLLPAWEQALLDLAAAYLAGGAEIDPKVRRETCKHCDLPMLCRIGEWEMDHAPAEFMEVGDDA